MFAEALSKSGGSLLEAPITGGLEALKKGQMAVWVAGDKVTLFFSVNQHMFRKAIARRSPSWTLATAPCSTLGVSALP